MMSETLRVLLIEDSERDAGLVLRALSNADHLVHARRVEGAVELRAALADEAWDVVISEYQLPGFSAPAALAIVHEAGRDIPFIVVSGTIGEDRAVALMKAGAADYVMKANLLRLTPAVVREVADARHRNARRAAEAAEAGLRSQLAESKREAYEQLAAWHRRLELTKDEERRTLSRELHDELGQTLTALKLRLKVVPRVGPTAVPAAVASSIDDALALVDSLIDRVRKISVDLRPPLLDELGLESALRAFVESQARASSTRWTLQATDLGQRLAPELEIACFRLVQEAVTNVLRHAGASSAAIRVSRQEDRLAISVLDDGCGLSSERLQACARGTPRPGRHAGTRARARRRARRVVTAQLRRAHRHPHRRAAAGPIPAERLRHPKGSSSSAPGSPPMVRWARCAKTDDHGIARSAAQSAAARARGRRLRGVPFRGARLPAWRYRCPSRGRSRRR
jgi:signal transduction histidine kinase